MMVCLQGSNDGELSDPFPVTNGVKQGCVLASTLFSMMFSAMLTDAFQDGDNGIPIRYRFDGKLFNIRRLQAKSKVQTEVLDEFLFADDMAKGAQTEEKMQKGVDQVSDPCDSYDLTISIKKTEVVYQPAPGKPCKEPLVRLSLLTMTNPNQLYDMLLFVCSKMADETNLSSKLPVADRTREV